MRRWFSSFSCLNLSQFLVTLNDSIYRLVITYSLVDVLGENASNRILSISGAIFVIPLLLFSMPAGQMADKYRKNKILIGALWAEVVFMCFGLLAIMSKDEFTAYFSFFLIAMQAAIFNPAKFAIIPEIEPKERLGRVNGWFVFFSYFSVILGTFLASFLSDVTQKNYPLVVVICIVFAVIALIAGYGIEETPIQNPLKKINVLFIVDVFRSLKLAWSIPYLGTAIFASSYFLYTAIYTLLNLLPFGIQSLKLSAVHAGYVYLCSAFGLGLGGVVVAIISRKRVWLWISIWGIFGTAFSYIFLYLFQNNIVIACIIFFSIGFHGSLYVVPMDAFIQLVSPDKERGSIVAAALFLAFVGALLASGTLYLLGQVFGLRAATGFLIIGCLTLVVSILVFIKLWKKVSGLIKRKQLTQ